MATSPTIVHDMREKRMGVFLSQSEMAKLLGVTSSYYNKLETGKAKPSSQLDKLIDYVIAEKKKSFCELDAETGGKNDRDSELDLNRHSPNPNHLESVSRCVNHISRFAMQCLAESPNRLYWLEEELRQRFKLTDSKPQ